MPSFSAHLVAFALLVLVICSPATAQQHVPITRVTLSSLAAQAFEAVILQGAEVYRYTLRLAEGSPISYQSDCFAVR